MNAMGLDDDKSALVQEMGWCYMESSGNSELIHTLYSVACGGGLTTHLGGMAYLEQELPVRKQHNTQGLVVLN